MAAIKSLSTPLQWAYDDGGRADAGFKGDARDCVTRSIAIATGRDYRHVYAAVDSFGRREGKKSAARTGVPMSAVADLMTLWLGWSWQATPLSAHLTAEDMPDLPVFIAVLSRGHTVAVTNGVARDTWNAVDRHQNGRMSRVAGVWLPRRGSANGNDQ